MARFLIELPHKAEVLECINAARILVESGSHFLTHADFGCKDGIHKAWIIMDVDSKEEARNILPHVYRRNATIVGLNKFSIKELEDLLEYHTGKGTAWDTQ